MNNETIRRRRWLIASSLILAALLGGAAGSWVTAKRAGTTIPLFLASASTQNGSVSLEGGFAPIVKQAVPAVANVSSSKIVRTPEGGSPFFNDPFFRQFFGDEFSRQFQVPRERRERSLGSAVIVSPDGYLLTNNHVVEGASEINVSLSDGREFKAEIVGTDPNTDLAILKVDEKNLPCWVGRRDRG